jgi:hypothetical protein
MTVTCLPEALLEIAPESVIASPRMPTLREAVMVTDREFGATETVPVNFESGSLYLNVPAFGNVHDPLCVGLRLSLHEVPLTATPW